jgi:hypothetical protein
VAFTAEDERWLRMAGEVLDGQTKELVEKWRGMIAKTPHLARHCVPGILRDVVAFTVVMNEAVRPFLTSEGHSGEEIEKMHSAWRKAVQLQIALWAQPYCSSALAPDEG